MAIAKKVKDTNQDAADQVTKGSPDFEKGEDETSENEGSTVQADTAEKDTADRVAEAAAKHSEAPAVIAAKTSAVSTSVTRVVSPIATLKDALHVDYDTFLQIQAVQGNFSDKLADKSLGDKIVLELLSFQSSHILATGEDQNNEAAAKLVKYSDDGSTTKDGRDCKEYINELLDAGYEKAKMSERCILVGSLVDSGKLPELEGQLVQIDLPPTSKKQFDRYHLQCGFDVLKGKYDAKSTATMEMTCTIAKNGKLSWTVVNFARFIPKK